MKSLGLHDCRMMRMQQQQRQRQTEVQIVVYRNKDRLLGNGRKQLRPPDRAAADVCCLHPSVKCTEILLHHGQQLHVNVLQAVKQGDVQKMQEREYKVERISTWPATCKTKSVYTAKTVLEYNNTSLRWKMTT